MYDNGDDDDDDNDDDAVAKVKLILFTGNSNFSVTVDLVPPLSCADQAWGQPTSCPPWNSQRGSKFCALLVSDRPHKLPDSVDIRLDGLQNCPVGHRGFEPSHSDSWSSQYY